MSKQELNRVELMVRVEERRLTQKNAAEMLGLSVRQVERLYRRYKQSGPAGLVSKKRGRPSNRRVPEKTRKQALGLVRGLYPDFGPTGAPAPRSPRGSPVPRGTELCPRDPAAGTRTGRRAETTRRTRARSGRSRNPSAGVDQEPCQVPFHEIIGFSARKMAVWRGERRLRRPKPPVATGFSKRLPGGAFGG